MLLAVAFVAMLYSWRREYSVRWYLDGFSEAIVPNSLPAEQKVEAILISAAATVFFLLLRAVLAWHVDSRLKIPRFRLGENANRAGAAFFSAPRIKQ